MRLTRLRFLAFVPPAMLVALAVLLSASSIVSALERTFTLDVSGPSRTSDARTAPPADVELRRIESECPTTPSLCPASAQQGAEYEIEEARPAVFFF